MYFSSKLRSHLQRNLDLKDLAYYSSSNKLHRFFQRGFTFVELSLALTFLTVLLITLSVLIIHITAIYQKGLVIRAVNATGRELVDDFTRSINAAPAKSAELLCMNRYGGSSDDINKEDRPTRKCIDDKASKFYYSVTTEEIPVGDGTQKETVPIHGAICTGHYSYIWNSGYVLKNKDDSNSAKLSNASVSIPDDSNYTFHLLKVYDDNLNICQNRLDDNYEYASTSNEYQLGTKDDNEPGGFSGASDVIAYELLPRSEDNLALYDLHMFAPVQHATTLHSFVSATFILGTVSGGIDITGAGDFCQDAPDNFNTDFNYCAINRFNFATRSTGDLTTTESNDETQRAVTIYDARNHDS